jgi:hypothetical protein
MPVGLSRIVLASVSLVDAEAIQGEARLHELEEQRRAQLEAVADEMRRFGLPVEVEMRRGADVLEAAVALVTELMRDRTSRASSWASARPRTPRLSTLCSATI